MKKLFIFFLGAWLFFIPRGASADIMNLNNTHSESIDEVLEEILLSQDVNELNQLKCDKITEEQFESLGDARFGIS